MTYATHIIVINSHSFTRSSFSFLQVDVVSPLQEVSLLVSKSQTEVEAIHKNLTSSISKLAGLSIRKSSMRQSGHKTELRVYALEGGAVLDGKELAGEYCSLLYKYFFILLHKYFFQCASPAYRWPTMTLKTCSCPDTRRRPRWARWKWPY